MEGKRVEKKHPKKHLWKPEEDLILKKYVEVHGEGNWATVSQKSGLKRGGKSCRLRWKNYLRPNIKRGGMSPEEEDLIIRMHKLIGNRWSLIAGRLPGRTDNEVKNYWNTHLNKRRPRPKRKHADTSGNHTTLKENNKPEEPKIQNANTDELEERKEEVKSFGYGIESPIMAENGPMFVFDDEPLPTYVDSFLFFEAFGCFPGASYAGMGMQSVIP